MGCAFIADAFGVEHYEVGSLPTLSSRRAGICSSPIPDRGRPNAGFCFCRYKLVRRWLVRAHWEGLPKGTTIADWVGRDAIGR